MTTWLFFICRCSHLCAEWEELEEVCCKRAAHLSKAITREQVRETEMIKFGKEKGFKKWGASRERGCYFFVFFEAFVLILDFI